jgi:hypothetical protein
MLVLAFGVTIPGVHTSLTHLETDARSCHAALGAAVPGRHFIHSIIPPLVGMYLTFILHSCPAFFCLIKKEKTQEKIQKEICEEQDWI